MIDNIPKDFIKNRKFVLELRFENRLSITDHMGTILDSIQAAKVFSKIYGEFNQFESILRDKEDSREARHFIVVGHNRLSLISTDIATVSSFYQKFIKIYELFKREIGDVAITRIGARIISTYPTKSTNYLDVLSKFKSIFPNKLFFKTYAPKDLSIIVVYESGRYAISPLNSTDDFIRKEFGEKTGIKHVGFALDTDNYLLNSSREGGDIKENIQAVFTLSLAVEKDLFTKLQDILNE